MINAINTALTGMLTQSQNLNIISNNVANSDTPGYNQINPVIEDIGYQNQGNSQIGLGSFLDSTYNAFNLNGFIPTGNPLDVALQGNEFLQVSLPNGQTAYTQNGQLQVNQNGYLTTQDGYLVSPNIKITANATSVNISRDGTVLATTPGQNNPQTVGQLQVATFQNPSALTNIGNNLYQANQSSGNPTITTPGVNSGPILSGYLNAPNVDMVNQMVNMLIAKNAYMFNTKTVTAGNDMLSSLLNAAV